MTKMLRQQNFSRSSNAEVPSFHSAGTVNAQLARLKCMFDLQENWDDEEEEESENKPETTQNETGGK